MPRNLSSRSAQQTANDIRSSQPEKCDSEVDLNHGFAHRVRQLIAVVQIPKALSRAVTIGLVVGTSVLSVAAQQNPPPAPRPVALGGGSPPVGRDQARTIPIGTARISGSVVSLSTQVPVSGARIDLSIGDAAVIRSVLTDSHGRFSLDSVPGARYSLRASASHFVGTSYGQTKPDRSGTAIQVADGQELGNLTIRLIPTAVVTGTLVDDNGIPLTGVMVRATRYSMRTGIRQLQDAGAAQTDDRGVYRIFDLAPGDYVVSAQGNGADLAANEQIARDARSLAIQVASGARTAMRLANGQTVQAVTLSGVEESVVASQRVSSYVPSYYPGTALPSEAQPISIAPGEERSGVTFSVLRIMAGSIQGTIHDASGAGALPNNISLTLTNEDPTAVSTGMAPTRVMPDGHFAFLGVPPGQYTITATARRPVVRTASAQPPRAPGTPPQESPTTHGPAAIVVVQDILWGRTRVVADGNPITDVSIFLKRGRTLSGEVVFDGTMTPPDLTDGRIRLSATLSPMPSAVASAVAIPQATVDHQGKFTINGIPPGRYSVRVTGAPGWSLKSSVAGGQDTLDVPIEITGEVDLTNVVVTLTDQHTELSGTLTDASISPALDCTIIAFAEDQQFWTAQSRRIQVARPGADGQFTVRNLPPGNYMLVAVRDVEPGGWFDPQFLRSLVAASIRVTLSEGDRHKQDLTVRFPTKD